MPRAYNNKRKNKNQKQKKMFNLDPSSPWCVGAAPDDAQLVLTTGVELVKGMVRVTPP